MLFLLLAPGWYASMAQETNIYRLQSLFLYNFTKHVKWNDTSDPKFVIGVMGGPEVVASLKEALQAKKANEKDIEVIAIRSAEEFGKCRIAYIARSESKRAAQYLSQQVATNTLVVTEEDLTSSGAAISFVFQNSKLNFRINRDRLEQAGLKVSGTLVSMAVSS